MNDIEAIQIFLDNEIAMSTLYIFYILYYIL